MNADTQSFQLDNPSPPHINVFRNTENRTKKELYAEAYSPSFLGSYKGNALSVFDKCFITDELN